MFETAIDPLLIGGVIYIGYLPSKDLSVSYSLYRPTYICIGIYVYIPYIYGIYIYMVYIYINTFICVNMLIQAPLTHKHFIPS